MTNGRYSHGFHTFSDQYNRTLTAYIVIKGDTFEVWEPHNPALIRPLRPMEYPLLPDEAQERIAAIVKKDPDPAGAVNNTDYFEFSEANGIIVRPRQGMTVAETVEDGPDFLCLWDVYRAPGFDSVDLTEPIMAKLLERCIAAEAKSRQLVRPEEFHPYPLRRKAEPVKAESLRERALAFVAGHPGALRRDVYKAIGGKQDRAVRIVDALIDLGELRAEKGAGRSEHIYLDDASGKSGAT